MIYVITHKDVELDLPKKYTLLKVGNNDCSRYDFCDSTGENISDKNFSFCELTGLYWIWKNQKDENVVGLVHYRRFFVKRIHNRIVYKLPFKLRLLSHRKINKILKAYDIILPDKINFDISIKEQYAMYHYEKDMDIIRSIIAEKYPDYITAFDTVMNGNVVSTCNMFVSNFDTLNDYCTWLFDVLFEAERLIDISDYPSYQKRLFGFLSERLLNVYCVHNKLRVYYSKI